MSRRQLTVCTGRIGNARRLFDRVCEWSRQLAFLLGERVWLHVGSRKQQATQLSPRQVPQVA